MRSGIGLALLVGALAAAFALGRAQAQEDDAAKKMMEAWAELGKPGPEQAALKKLAGDWTAHTKEFMPDGTAKESKTKSKFTMVLGDLILRQDYSGEMNGTPFTGLGYTGFDKGSGRYQSVWMDSMSSGMMCSIGTKQEDGSIEYKGHFFGPGGAKIPTRVVLKYPDDDTQQMEFYMDMGTGEMKSVEITYKRVK
ncbi:MAG: DUF1579 family protein [Planctomycetota bacterium]|jgi:hypothetical protein